MVEKRDCEARWLGSESQLTTYWSCNLGKKENDLTSQPQCLLLKMGL